MLKFRKNEKSRFNNDGKFKEKLVTLVLLPLLPPLLPILPLLLPLLPLLPLLLPLLLLPCSGYIFIYQLKPIICEAFNLKNGKLENIKS